MADEPLNPLMAGRLKAVLAEAGALPTAEREPFVRSRCGDDEALMTAALGRLGAIGDEDPTVETPPDGGPGRPRDGRIGDFSIKNVIASGGMGTVYLAVQERPHRKVALKVMKQGIASRSALRRFELESQTLARLHHPNVAQVYEAGTHNDGSGDVPYFAMEYVPGARSITEFATVKRLGTRARLGLFAKVCDAIHHGHQKGIIHRDLKPGNILVDSAGQPKIIDFGVARSTDSDLAVTTLQTDIGQLIGTLQYMSPEQCAADPDDIDTRSDVYALGVVLYELLCERLPYDVSRTGIPEAARLIREQSPAKPSTIDRALRGDVETITLKALEKDRDRRYKSVEALADDVRHYLANEPIQAHPPSVAYQLARFTDRHRAVVFGTVAVFVVLVLGIIGTTLGMVQARRSAQLATERLDQVDAARAAEQQQRVSAERRQREAEEARARAETAEAVASRRADELRQVAEFQSAQLGDLDVALMGTRMRAEVLVEARASMERAGVDEAGIEERAGQLRTLLAGTNFTDVALTTLDENVFTRALDAVAEEFDDQPLVRASLLHALGGTMRDLGLHDRAEAPQAEALAIRRRELGADDPETLSAVSAMGGLRLRQGKMSEAERLCREALDGWRSAVGEDDARYLSALNDMGAVLREQGKGAEAEPFFREALAGSRRALDDGHAETMRSLANVGAMLQGQGRHAEAEQHLGEALATARRVWGEDHPGTMNALNNMGYLLHARGTPKEAEPYFRDALAGRRRMLGDEHPATLQSLNNMGFLLYGLGDLPGAVPYFSEALEIRLRVLGRDHPSTINSLNNLASVLQKQGMLSEAEPHFRSAVEASRRVLGTDHSMTLSATSNLGLLLADRGKLAEAEASYREALLHARRALREDHAVTLAVLGNLGALLNRQERFEEAETLLREAHTKAAKAMAGHWRVAELKSLLGEALAGQGRFADAEPLLVEARSELDAGLPAGRRTDKLPPATERLVVLYQAWDREEDAAVWRERLAQLRPGE